MNNKQRIWIIGGILAFVIIALVVVIASLRSWTEGATECQTKTVQ